MTSSILNVDCLKATLMLLSVLNYSNSTSVPSSSDHDNIPDIKLDEINNFVALKIQLDGVISLDQRIWVADSTPIISIDVWNAFLAKLDGSNLAKLELQDAKRHMNNIVITNRVKKVEKLKCYYTNVIRTSR